VGVAIRRFSLIVPLVVVLALGVAWMSAAAAGANTKFPHRNTSSNPQCAGQPGHPTQAPIPALGGNSQYPIVAGIDANGCDSWPYELAPSFGVRTSFFAGSGFQPGNMAFEYGTKETTELLDGHQLITVSDPTREWRRVYAGYDSCGEHRISDGTSQEVCIAPALLHRPDDVWEYIPAGVILVLLLTFVVYHLRPAGPIPRRRHYRQKHEALAKAVAQTDESNLADVDVKQLQRRLRRLEKIISPELSDSQHHWFTGLVASGRHGLALESLSRWFVQSGTPIPDHIRSEFLWIASSIDVEREVLPILDAQVHQRHHEPVPETPPLEGFDVPLEQFEELVAEAVDSLPEEFGRAMSNVAVVVEEEAQGQRLFGLYQGHPLTHYRIRQWSVHPDKIIIYRRTICEHCRTEQEVRAQVYRTVIHEIAHHFGIGDPRLRALGW
jgi:predicted Zn-dependent protease with MMP-like domain